MPHLRPSKFLVHSEVAVGSGSTVVLPESPGRVYVLLANDSDITIYIKINGEDAEVSKGVPINADGGAYELSIPAGNISGARITAIHKGLKTKNLLVLEGHNR